MSTTREVSLVFAGPGPVTLDNTKALLNDFLKFGPENDKGIPEWPENFDVLITLPLTESHCTEALEAFLEWTDSVDAAYEVVHDDEDKPSRAYRQVVKWAENSSQEANPNAAAIQWLKDQEGEKYLVLAWGEDGDENAEVLLDLADSYGIPALDLTQGLDKLGFGTGETKEDPEAEPEPEPEPEKPAKKTTRKRTAKKTAEVVPEPPTVESVREKVKAEQEAHEKPAEGSARGSAGDLMVQAAAAAAEAPRADADPAVTERSEAQAKTIKPEIVERFAYHPPTTTTGPQHEAARVLVLDLAGALNNLLDGESREKSLALTKLEEAMFWANAHIARHHKSRGRGRPRKDS